MFEIFKIGFLSFYFTDLIDIVVVSIIFYKLYKALKGTIAAQIFLGLILVLALSFISQAVNLRALSWILKLLSDIWVIAFLILFQPEIRKLLANVARNPIFKIFVRSYNPESASIIAEAAFELSQKQHGALIIISRSSGMRSFLETGLQINATLTKDLLTSLFFPRSPLHDGAVFVKGNIIEAARCTLPLSNSTSLNGVSLGMRHRAGLGISEQADVISVIVSEETGAISVAEEGRLIRGLSKEGLRKKLDQALKSKKES